LVGHHSQSGRGGGEENSQSLSGFEPPIIQLVAQRYTTELSRILIWTNKSFPLLEQIKVKVKVKLSLCLFLTQHHAIKAYWGVKVQLHSFFDLGIRWR
jgi:hypothetical protein